VRLTFKIGTKSNNILNVIKIEDWHMEKNIDSIFFKGEKEKLLETIYDCVVKHPITVPEIIRVIQLASEYKDYGYYADDILQSKLLGIKHVKHN